MEDLRVKRTKNSLFQAFWKLLSVKSIEKISISELCDNAIIGRATFYLYFDDKYDLFEFCVEKIRLEVFESQLDKLENVTTTEFYKKLIYIAFDYIEENREVFTKMLKNNNDDMLRDLLLGTMTKQLEKKLQQDKSHFQVPISVIANYFVGGFISVALWWIKSNSKIHKKDMVEYINNLMEDKFYI